MSPVRDPEHAGRRPFLGPRKHDDGGRRSHRFGHEGGADNIHRCISTEIGRLVNQVTRRSLQAQLAQGTKHSREKLARFPGRARSPAGSGMVLASPFSEWPSANARLNGWFIPLSPRFRIVMFTHGLVSLAPSRCRLSPDCRAIRTTSGQVGVTIMQGWSFPAARNHRPGSTGSSDRLVGRPATDPRQSRNPQWRRPP